MNFVKRVLSLLLSIMDLFVLVFQWGLIRILSVFKKIMIDLNFITTFYFLLLILSHIFVSFFENLNILVDFFHRKNCKNLHEFAPVASSDNLLFEATINKNIQDSKFFYHNNSSVSFHFLYGVIKGMLFIEHFMKNDTK